ncbi:MAG: putative sulfate exporter family transporter [Deltaproteobacteria bacterium]|nr:putative sulfate exporter family transporter [Deltaproteobacteria bacterium]
MFKIENVPGVLLLIVVAVISTFASDLVIIGGKHPLEASAVAVVLGILIRNFNYVPDKCRSGVNLSEKLLIIGIVLMGAGLDLTKIGSQGAAMLSIILVTMVVGFFLIFFVARFVQLPIGLSMLLAVGTTICGTSAIAVTAPLIKAREEETSYAIATVALFGLIAILLYPYIGHLFHASDLEFGVFAGTAIHSTPQVIGAGYIYSDSAGQTATAVKLVRNCFMAPVAILIAIWFSRNSENEAVSKINFWKAFPWFLFGYFVMAGCNSQGLFSATLVEQLSSAGKFLILLGMAGVGLNTNFAAFKTVGLKPLLVGFLGAVIVAVVSATMIAFLI